MTYTDVSPLDIGVSIYKFNEWTGKDGKKKSGYTFVAIDTLRNVLTNNDQGEKILQVRRGHLRKDSILTYTPAGIWEEKRASSIPPKSMTNQVQVDIDGAANPGITKFKEAIFETFPEITAIGNSVRGSGLFILFNTDGRDYEASFNAICADLEAHNIVVDSSVSSVNELRFMTLNNDVLTREHPAVYTKKVTKKKQTKSEHLTVQGEAIPIPANGDWHYVDAVSYVGKCNASGVDKSLCLNELLKEKVFSPLSHLATSSDQVEQLVEKVYSKYADQFGTKKPLISVNEALRNERAGKQQADIKIPDNVLYNEINHSLYLNRERLDNKTLHELWWATPNRPSFDNFNRQMLAKAPRWNPIKEFFETPWSGVDQFALLAKYIDTDPTFEVNLKQHIIRGVNQICNPESNRINRYIFILQGGTHIGKSELLRKLTLRHSLPWFSSEFSMGGNEKDVHTLLCTIPNLINEEVDTVSSRDIKNLKPIISYSGGQLRLPYDRVATKMDRVATLWGSVNPNEFLLSVDDRWIIHEIKGINFEYSNEVDFEDLWRQAYTIWALNHAAGELSKEAVKELSDKAQEHVIVTPLEQYLMTFFKVSINDEIMNLNDIRQCVTDQYKNINDRQLATSLANCFPDSRIGRKKVGGVRGTWYGISFFPPYDFGGKVPPLKTDRDKNDVAPPAAPQNADSDPETLPF